GGGDGEGGVGLRMLQAAGLQVLLRPADEPLAGQRDQAGLVEAGEDLPQPGSVVGVHGQARFITAASQWANWPGVRAAISIPSAASRPASCWSYHGLASVSSAARPSSFTPASRSRRQAAIRVR